MENDPQHNISISDGLQKIKKMIIEDRFDRFVLEVCTAVEIYMSVDEPSLVALEIRNINELCKTYDPDILGFMKNVSKSTLDILEQVSPLPPLPKVNDEMVINHYCNDLRERLIIKFTRRSDRWHAHPIGQIKRGKVSNNRIDILVSFLAVAYARATNKNPTRKWSAARDTEFEVLISIIFETVGEGNSIDWAIRNYQLRLKNS